MTIAYHTPRATYLRCELRVGLWSGDTAPTNFSDPINFTKVELTSPVQETETLLSNMITGYGTALDSQNKPTEAATLSATFDTVTPYLINLALGADVAEQTQTGAGVVDELVTTALNIWVPLANRYLDDAVAATMKTNGDVAVTADKFEVDYVNGMVKAIHADAVGTDWKLSYTTDTRTWEEYDAGQAKSAYVQLRGQAIDMVSNETGILEVFKASLAADGAFDPVVGGYLAGNVAGDMIAPTGYTSPWRWQNVTA